MEILWLAILLYSVGLAVVLQLRPSLMFHENGTWKEFGYQRGARFTLMPFWLFAIVWAVVSYSLAAAVAWSLSGPAPMSMAAAASATMASRWSSRDTANTMYEGSYTDDDDDADMIAVSAAEEEAQPEVFEVPRRGRGRPRKSEGPGAKPRAGYYVLDPASREGGLRRYIYYGAAPPAPVAEAE